MPNTGQTVTFDQMKGTIGSLVFLWSGIEQTLSESIETLLAGGKSKSAHGISRSLDAWSYAINKEDNSRVLQVELSERLVKLLKKALVIRKLVCHGLVGISAQRHTDDTEAHLKVRLGDHARVLTWQQLDEMFRWMSRSRCLIHDLTDAAMENDDQRANARLFGWETFPEQQ